jgi:hypothetical protein
MSDPEAAPNPPGAQVHTATLTTATTGMVLWALDRWLFHGYIPPEVFVFVSLAVPALLGRLGAQWAYRRAQRRHEGS